MQARVDQLSLMTQLNKKGSSALSFYTNIKIPKAKLIKVIQSFEAVFSEQKKEKAEVNHNKLLSKKSQGRAQ